jgi:hypothetical protein
MATITITVEPKNGHDDVTAIAEALFDMGIGANDERTGEEWVNMEGCDYIVTAITCSEEWTYGEYNRETNPLAKPMRVV